MKKLQTIISLSCLLSSLQVAAQQETFWVQDSTAADKSGMVKVEDHSSGATVSEMWMTAEDAEVYLREKQDKAQRMRANPPDYSHLSIGEKMHQMEEDHRKYGIPLPYKNEQESKKYYRGGKYNEILKQFQELEQIQISKFQDSTDVIAQATMIPVQFYYHRYDSDELKTKSLEELDARSLSIRKEILSHLPLNSFQELDADEVRSGVLALNVSSQALYILYQNPLIKNFVEQSILDNLEIKAF